MKTLLLVAAAALAGCASRKIVVLPPVYIPYAVPSNASEDMKACIETIRRVGDVNADYHQRLADAAKAK